MTYHRPFRSVAAACAAVLAPLVLIGCGDDDDGQDAQPSPFDSTFVEGSFDDVPLYGGASPIGPVSETEEGVRTGSFAVNTAAPRTIIQFYDQQLPGLGWASVVPVQETSDDTWRGSWLREGRRLQIVTSPLRPATEDPSDAQLNIILSDDASAPGSVSGGLFDSDVESEPATP